MTINSPFGIEIAIRIYLNNNRYYDSPWPGEWVNFYWIQLWTINIELFHQYKHPN